MCLCNDPELLAAESMISISNLFSSPLATVTEAFLSPHVFDNAPMLDSGTARELHAPKVGQHNFAVVSVLIQHSLARIWCPCLDSHTVLDCTVLDCAVLYCCTRCSAPVIGYSPGCTATRPETVATTLSGPCSATTVAVPHTSRTQDSYSSIKFV